MAGFKLYTSNRLESLLDALTSVVGEPLSSPLESEVVVVQSKGMERWLSMELAKKFAFPSRPLSRLSCRVKIFSPQMDTDGRGFFF